LADAKKALNSLLYNNGVSKFSFETSMDTKVVFPIKVNQNLVSILVENHKRKLNKRASPGAAIKLCLGDLLVMGSNPETASLHMQGTVLGLPPTGPLKIEDVKNAFQLSALKWHPDKHQGPSQAMAEEKFKLCVNAYKTLCNALSPS
ncbi:hypothetical protein D0Y65_014744, partial [Glycine soja]